ncbi:UDP-N-acetylglucosamine 2-epimerase [Elusimicrobiota bacterium]
MRKRKIAVFTSTRADYSLLYWLMKELQGCPRIDFQMIVSGTHLISDFGSTAHEIEGDGFSIAAKVPMRFSGGSEVSTAKAFGEGASRLADTLADLKPDILVVLGDRYELLACCGAAVGMRIPIAHIHGGELTLGVIDEQVRHAVTKMSHLHFTTSECHRRRVIQMGEGPSRVFNVGAPGVEHLLRARSRSRRDVEKKLKFKFKKPTILLTFHPVTLEKLSGINHLKALLGAIDDLGVRSIITYANSDAGGRPINNILTRYASKNMPRTLLVPSLGRDMYINAMRYVDAVVGNSSSGVIEAPSLKVPAVNVGNRQQGRLRASSVIDSKVSRRALSSAIKKALSDRFRATQCTGKNPYGSNQFSKETLKILCDYPIERISHGKDFYDIRYEL